ncbi:hypothetical protein IQ218_00730 [Synechocystis salina LEGE 06099]|uniref:hypothetical protein n=1 Tax=Synechocystis salina TaxID=945780 RepID=UPI0018814005|nr:hypothetical protein [Synechocystis salina]MBE9202266.1 hypothetical protein [Synechocystis salina LEGE 06099]
MFDYPAAIIALVIGGYQLLAIAPLVAGPSDAIDNGFENMMQGFPECQFEGMYIAPWEGIDQPSQQFFDGLSPEKIEDDFAYYQIKTNYYDLPVTEIMIPAGTWGVYAVTFDVPMEISQERLQQVFGSSFETNEASELGLAPQLIIDPDDAQKSIWLCTSPF